MWPSFSTPRGAAYLGFLVFVPPRRDLTFAPSAALRISGTLLGNHPPFHPIDHPLKATGMVATTGTVHR